MPILTGPVWYRINLDVVKNGVHVGADVERVVFPRNSKLARVAAALGDLIMKGTLLLIEDSKFLRAASARLLTNAGFTVKVAGDGEEGLRLVQESPPDLILLDMLLPKMGGAQVLQALKQDSVTAHIPVIVLSSLSQQNETKLKDEGAALYFEKSRLESETGSATLVAAIERLLGASRVVVRSH